MVDGELDLIGIVARAQAGDDTAFQSLFEHFAAPLFRYFYLRCGDVHVAEDLTSELWVRVVAHLPTFHVESDTHETVVIGWLYRIAHRLLLDTYRRRAREHLPLPESLPAREPPLDDMMLQVDEHQELRTVLKHLTPEQREVLLLRFVEERTPGEVAHITGQSVGAVRVMQHRALAALTKLLKRPDEEVWEPKR